MVFTTCLGSLTHASNSERLNSHQAAWHVQPDSMIVVFNGPVNVIARQAVLTGECCDVTILDAA